MVGYSSGSDASKAGYIRMILMTAARLSALSLLLAAAVTAQTAGGLPPKVAALVPQGAKVSSQSFAAVPTMAAAEFSADRSISAGRSVRYHFELHVFDTSSPLWKMKEPFYRQQMEQRVAQKRKGLTPEAINSVMFTADPVKETKYGWGTGLTQRVLNHPPQAKEYVDYQCAYFGMIGGVTFELIVSGAPDSAAEADQWAQNVAQAAAKLSVSNVAEK
jgi:hypothetical protein